MSQELDATNQSLGRLASKIAILLRGKDDASYTPNELVHREIVVKNLNNVKFTGNKLNNKLYHKYSGFHGGIKTRNLSELWAQKPQYVLRKMVYDMLPKNRLREKMIKNLKFK